MTDLGIEIEEVRAQRRRFACSCLDWSMRRLHLAGALGAAFLQTVISRKLVIQELDSRALALTSKGRKELSGRLGMMLKNKELERSVVRNATRPAEPALPARKLLIPSTKHLSRGGHCFAFHIENQGVLAERLRFESKPQN